LVKKQEEKFKNFIFFEKGKKQLLFYGKTALQLWFWIILLLNNYQKKVLKTYSFPKMYNLKLYDHEKKFALSFYFILDEKLHF